MEREVHLEGFYTDRKNKKHPYKLWTMPYLSESSADRLLAVLSDPDFPLETEPLVKMGVSHRRVGFFSDESSGYYFSGQKTKSLPLTTHRYLPRYLHRINKLLDTNFNGELINHYRSTSDSIGKHSDSKKNLCNGTVAAISVGIPRTFRIRDKITGKIVIDIQTAHGQLLVMEGAFQDEFTHEIPVEKSKKVQGERVSITFRMHKKD